MRTPSRPRALSSNHVLQNDFILWFAQGDERFPNDLREIVEDPANGVFASEVSVLEIAIKHAKNPSAMPYSDEDFVELCEEGGFDLRPLTREAIFAYGILSFEKVGDLHKDPFDRHVAFALKDAGSLVITWICSSKRTCTRSMRLSRTQTEHGLVSK